MKKTTLALVFLTLAACSEQKETADPGTGYGKVALNIATAAQVGVTTKTAVEADDAYRVIIRHGNDIAKSGTYGNMKDFFAILPGLYTITAQSCTETEALAGRGVQRFTGGTVFIVNPGQTIPVSFECSMANARISVGYTDNFKTVFSDYCVEISENSLPSRKIVFDSAAAIDDEATWSHFNITADPKVTVTVRVVRNDGSGKSYTQEFPIAAKTWYKLSVDATALNGQAEVGIAVDGTVLFEHLGLNIDPYEQFAAGGRPS